MDALSDCVSSGSQSGLDHKWGFYVYRTTFEDQELFERYIKYIHNAVTVKYQSYYGGLHPTLAPKVSSSFRLIVKEDKSLDGLTYDNVRDIFVRWTTTGEVESDRWINFDMYGRYFIYVDRDTLEKFRRIDDAREGQLPDYAAEAEEVPFIMVNAPPVQEEDPDDILNSKFEEDYATDEDAGKEWQYVAPFYIPNFVDLHQRNGEAWYRFFERPPAVWTGP
ncbi:hypothetical protein F4777DRAFT_569453 [Nemania sp. FL0916]|nr:hypothetical protein F4777DRAFT_569453 [Nemania sp. FL0916]